MPEVSILEGAYLKILPSKITALIGRNGAGKSTLIKVAAGQVQPSGGITILDGIRIHKKSVSRRFQKIGYLPQNSMLPVDMSVNRLIDSLPSAHQFSEEQLIKKIRGQKVHELSGGEKRFLELSILFGLRRKYLLLDEPFTGVEPYIIDLIIDKMQQQANKGTGILVTDHLHRYISTIADISYLMHEKQCYQIHGDVTHELRKLGYLKSKE